MTLDEIKAVIQQNNNSPFTTELVVGICWAESSFDPNKVAGGDSTSAGLMMMNPPAVDTVNANTTAGIHFEYADMLDAVKAVSCGTWYLQIIYNHAGNQDKRETLRL